MREDTRLYAGASRTCITPGPEYFPIEHFNNHMTRKPSIFSGKIAEDIFFRVIVVENKRKRIVFAVMDLPGVPESKEITQLIADCAGVSEEYVIYTATHNHSGLYADNPEFEHWYGEEFGRKIRKYRKFLRDLIPGAVQEAIDRLQPARMGIIKGESYLNVNRNEKELGPKAGTYGFRVGGPADRDLYIMRFDDRNGKPIALMYNYAVHACMMIHNNPEGIGTEISGDLPGRACRILEQAWEDKTVVIFTSGAAGDLNPLMMSRVNIVEPDGRITTKDLGAAGPVILEFMGNRLARDILSANAVLECNTEEAVIWAERKSFSVSASAVTKPGNSNPVEFRVGLIMLGDVALISSNGEIFHEIGRRLKRESPYKKTLFITHAGEWTAYVKDDSGDGEYEVQARKAVGGMMDDFAGARGLEEQEG